MTRKKTTLTYPYTPSTLPEDLRMFTHRAQEPTDNLLRELFALAGDVDRFLQQYAAQSEAGIELELKSMRGRLEAIRYVEKSYYARIKL